MHKKDNTTPKYIPVTKWNDYFDWPTEKGLRYLIFKAKEKGFEKVIKRPAGRILIDVEQFHQWVENNG